GASRIEVSGPPHRSMAIRYAIVLEERRPATEADRARLAAQAATLAASRLEQGEAAERHDAVVRYEEAQALWRKASDRRGETAAPPPIGRAAGRGRGGEHGGGGYI